MGINQHEQQRKTPWGNKKAQVRGSYGTRTGDHHSWYWSPWKRGAEETIGSINKNYANFPNGIHHKSFKVKQTPDRISPQVLWQVASWPNFPTLYTEKHHWEHLAKWVQHRHRNNEPDTSRFLIGNHGGQKTPCLSSPERKERLTLNPVPHKNILWEGRGQKDILKRGKTKTFVTRKPTTKDRL